MQMDENSKGGKIELIQQILTTDPSKRPTRHEIVDRLFFTEGTVPSRLPSTAHGSTSGHSFGTEGRETKITSPSSSRQNAWWIGDINEEVDEVREVAIELRNKEPKSQEARIVAQMVLGDTAGNLHEQENDPPMPDSPSRFKEKTRAKDTRGTQAPRESRLVKAPAPPCTFNPLTVGAYRD